MCENMMKNCRAYHQCGACNYCLNEYNYSLVDKQKKMESLFKGYKVNPIIGMKNPYGYRHKVTVTFAKSKGKIIAGTYQEDSHKVVSVDQCALHHPLANKIVNTVLRLVNDYGYTVYNEDTHQGQLRHLQLRISTDGHALLTFVLGTFVLKGSRQFFAQLKQAEPSIVSIVENLNTRKTSIVLGDKNKVVLGKGYVIDQMDGLSFQISNKSFYQVNPSQALVCYQLAIDGLKLTKQDTVLDAYCGIGTIASFMARYSRHATGVELNKLAVFDARNNAKINKIDNVTFIARNVDQYVLDNHFDCVMVDPPRSGCSQSFLNALIHNNPRKIGYISCNPQTQARDIKVLTQHGYKVEFITPVDMFPFTQHVETVVLLSKLNTKKDINI